MSNYNTDRAKDLLRHYFRLMALAAGVRWDGDNDSELEDIVDCLIAAAVEEMRSEQPAVQGQMFPNGDDLPLFTQS